MNGLRITLAAGVAAALACTFVTFGNEAVAHADEETGLAVGLRVAYAIPFGDAQTTTLGGSSVTTSMYSLDRGMLPVMFELGYRFTPSVYVGLFYQYGVTFPPSNGCYSYNSSPAAGQGSCDGYDQRFGVDLQYHLRPHAFVDPWIGLGLGWEMTQLNLSAADATQSSFQAWGPQIDLQLGADLRFSHRIPFGPFVDLSLSEFNTESKYDSNNNGSPVAFNGTVHGWVSLGLRAQFNL
jgi:Autotransporter beta-domain